MGNRYLPHRSHITDGRECRPNLIVSRRSTQRTTSWDLLNQGRGATLPSIAIVFSRFGLVVIFLVCVSLLDRNSGRCSADDDAQWSTWRGPKMSGVSSSGSPPLSWSETENIRWKVSIPGEGSGSPIIWNERVILLAAIDRGPDDILKAPEANATTEGERDHVRSDVETLNRYDFVIQCLERDTGRSMWSTTLCSVVPHEGKHASHGYASYSPVTDGEHLWVSLGSRGLYCLNLNGDRIWSQPLIQMRTRNAFGEGSSVALAGDVVVVVMDHEGESHIRAFDKRTGEESWDRVRDEPTSWSTPLVIESHGRTQVVVNATNRIRCYDAVKGDLVWECGGQTMNVVPSPVAGHGLVYCASGRQGNALQAIELGQQGDLTGTDSIRWQVNRHTPYVPSPLRYGDRLYVYASNLPILSCYEAKTGKVIFETERIDSMHSVYASPVGAAGRIYLAGRQGVVAVIANHGHFELLASNRLDDGFDASPAIVGDSIFLRGRKHFYRIAQ